MIERLPRQGEPDSVRVGRLAGYLTLLFGETATVISALEAHSTEVFAGGTVLTLGVAALAAAKVPKILGYRDGDTEQPR